MNLAYLFAGTVMLRLELVNNNRQKLGQDLQQDNQTEKDFTRICGMIRTRICARCDVWCMKVDVTVIVARGGGGGIKNSIKGFQLLSETTGNCNYLLMAVQACMRNDDAVQCASEVTFSRSFSSVSASLVSTRLRLSTSWISVNWDWSVILKH